MSLTCQHLCADMVAGQELATDFPHYLRRIADSMIWRRTSVSRFGADVGEVTFQNGVENLDCIGGLHDVSTNCLAVDGGANLPRGSGREGALRIRLPQAAVLRRRMGELHAPNPARRRRVDAPEGSRPQHLRASRWMKASRVALPRVTARVPITTGQSKP